MMAIVDRNNTTNPGAGMIIPTDTLRVVTLLVNGETVTLTPASQPQYARLTTLCQEEQWPILSDLPEPMIPNVAAIWYQREFAADLNILLNGYDATNPGRTVSALCVERDSCYTRLSNVRCYTHWHDARTFDRATPIIAHPPCRGWSKALRHLAKPPAGEMELGLQCCEWLKTCGGVLEHPAGSHLFNAGGLPPAGTTAGPLTTIEVLQSWWGFPCLKRTWLCFSRIDMRQIVPPYTLHTPSRSGKRFESMTRKTRSHTTAALAHWLVNAARLTTIPSNDCVAPLAADPRPPLRPNQPRIGARCAVCGVTFEACRQHATTCGSRCRKRLSRMAQAAQAR
jgi:hypothetical protein